MRTIGRDMVLTLFDQGAQDGTPNTPGTAVANPGSTGISALAKSVKYECRGNTVDVSAEADTSVALRGTFTEESVDVDCAVASGGIMALTLNNYYAATIKVISSLAVLCNLTGILTKNGWSSGGDGPQSQSITVEGPAE